MGQYVEIKFSGISQEQSDLLIALLNEIGFEGFEEQESDLKAFIISTDYDEISVDKIARSLQVIFSKSIIEETNWNQLWESNFEPIVVDGFAAIRADFHQPIKDVELEIIITPKMSFGTGHHATTYMMIQQMKGIDFIGKTVFDFGTGTGVLSILAEKLGAKSVLAIDNDNWSITNADENIRRNNCKRINISLADTPVVQHSVDIILANINKNVILDNLKILAKQVSPAGVLLLSGLLLEHEEDILNSCKKYGLQLIKKTERHNWLLLNLSP